MRIFIGSSSSENMPYKYVKDCKKMLEILLKNNDLIFGVYNKGLMGISYEIAKKNNGIVTGICPKIYQKSIDLLECDKTEITDSILDSTIKIYNNSDVLILLPGGFGTIYEFFTANYCKICNEIDIPIILYNSCGYYNKLLSFINDIVDEKIIKEQELAKYFVANNTHDILSYLTIISETHNQNKNR